MQDFVAAAIDAALAPGRFFVAGATLAWRHDPHERLRWEIFRGHLLDERRTRGEAEFDTRSVLFCVPGEPRPQQAISLRTATAEGCIYITRELWVQGQETYEPAPNVIDTRPALVLERELVGTIDLRRFADAADLTAELGRYVLLALTGTSRLPITSVESPLPAFSFGRWGYLPGGKSQPGEPATNPHQWIERGVPAAAGDVGGLARVLELALRAAGADEILPLSRAWQQRLTSAGLRSADTVRAAACLFNQVSLTPYTGLVDNLIACCEALVDSGHLDEMAWVDLVGFMLRQLARHLAAFDLVTFHNEGANYPDALLIESLVAVLLPRVERRPEWFLAGPGDSQTQSAVKRLRRRALRGAWGLVHEYAGRAVPDLPTSPGENARSLAGTAYHVPGEQLHLPAARRRKLFARGLPAPSETLAAVLEQGIEDLSDPGELGELGTALFLDRPLGLLKQPGAIDRTPLVSYEAFSRGLAVRRLKYLGPAIPAGAARAADLTSALAALADFGLPVEEVPPRLSPGVVALEDAVRSAADFRLVRTTRGSLDGLLAAYDLQELAERSPAVHEWLLQGRDVLAVRTAQRSAAVAGEPFFTACDRQLRPRIRLAAVRTESPYCEAAGSELLAAGLRVAEIDGQACDLKLPARR